MKKRLCKAMPHVPLLKIRPELSEQETYDQGGTENNDVVDGDEENVDDNTACQAHSEDDTRKTRKFFQPLIKRIRFRKKQYDNDEIALVEM